MKDAAVQITCMFVTLGVMTVGLTHMFKTLEKETKIQKQNERAAYAAHFAKEAQQ